MILFIIVVAIALITFLLRMRIIGKEKNDRERLDVLMLLPVSEETEVEKRQITRRLGAYALARFRAAALMVVLGIIAIGLIVLMQLHNAGII